MTKKHKLKTDALKAKRNLVSMLSIRISELELEYIEKMAEQFAYGNKSVFVRQAILRWKPKTEF